MRYVVFNRKGGVGKSTIVCNLAAVNAMSGRRTLVIDLDPQGNATQYLTGHDAGELQPGLAEFFESTLGFKLLRSLSEEHDIVHHSAVDGLHLLPSSPELQELQTKLETRHKIYKLRDLLGELGAYQDVFIDTPPALGFYTISALIASESCLIPFDCDEFSRRALFQLLDTVREVREDHNPGLRVGGVVVNQFQGRAKLPAQLVDELRQEGLPVLEPFLSSSVKVRESHRAHRPLVDYLPRHKVSGEFRDLHAAIATA